MPEKGWAQSVTEIGSVYTTDMKRVWGICRVCYAQQEFGMITGDPGTGKTYSLTAFLGHTSNPTVFITCDETSTIKSILIDTAEGLRLDTKGSSSTLLRRIIKKLKKEPHLLIFDEADLLRKPCIYETIRAIYDKTKTIGVVFCGNHNLAEKILLYAEDRPEMARIRDRIGYYIKLYGINEEETEKFLSRINLTAGAKQALTKIGSKRGIRQLIKALGRLLDVTKGNTITEELVEELGQIVLSFNA